MSTWVDAGYWFYILAAVVFGFWTLDYLRSWWSWWKKKDEMVAEIRGRNR